jgi:hypothetical protein
VWEANVPPVQTITACAELPTELGLPAVPSAAHADPLTDRPQQARDTAAIKGSPTCWSKQAWAARTTVLMTEAQNATRSVCPRGAVADRMHQTALRRRAYSLLAEARDAITHTRREWSSRRDWTKVEATIRALEERCDAVTADIVAARRR